jgi:hypothetical protein
VPASHSVTAPAAAASTAALILLVEYPGQDELPGTLALPASHCNKEVG